MCEAWVAVTPTNPCRAFFSACLRRLGLRFQLNRSYINKYIDKYIYIDTHITYIYIHIHVHIYRYKLCKYMFIYIYICVCVYVCVWVAVTPTNPCRAFFSACLNGFGVWGSDEQVARFKI